MAKKNRSQARLRRHRRVRKDLFGSASRPRLNVFRSLNHIYAQLIDDQSGNTLISASTIDPELRTTIAGKTKTEKARLVGELLGQRALDQGLNEVVFDRGGFRYMGRVKALAEGARKAGMVF